MGQADPDVAVALRGDPPDPEVLAFMDDEPEAGTAIMPGQGSASAACPGDVGHRRRHGDSVGRPAVETSRALSDPGWELHDPVHEVEVPVGNGLKPAPPAPAHRGPRRPIPPGDPLRGDPTGGGEPASSVE